MLSYFRSLPLRISRLLNAASGRNQKIIDRFHGLYYDSHLVNKTWYNTSWLGVTAWKCPLDLWVYQEIIYEIKPDLIVETGTAFGGSALYLACLCDILKGGEVVTIDVDSQNNRPVHQRITYLQGSSVSEQIFAQVVTLCKGKKRVMIMLDSDHRKEHVLKELELYSALVSKDSYIIVEDTNVNGHPVYPGFGPGPMEAVKEFLRQNKNFVVDRSKEKLLLTFSPQGFLKRVN